MDVQTDRMNNVIKPLPRHRETIRDLVNDIKGSRRTAFNFTEELENCAVVEYNPFDELDF